MSTNRTPYAPSPFPYLEICTHTTFAQRAYCLPLPLNRLVYRDFTPARAKNRLAPLYTLRLCCTGVMPQGAAAKMPRSQASASSAAAPVIDEADEMAEYYEGEGGTRLPLTELAWDLDCSRGQSRSLDLDYVSELEGNLRQNPVIDFLPVYVWNAGTYGMLRCRCSCSSVTPCAPCAHRIPTFQRKTDKRSTTYSAVSTYPRLCSTYASRGRERANP